MSTTRNGLLALLGLGAVAYYKYRKSSPEDQQKVKDQFNNVRDNISKLGGDLKSKASDLAGQAESKAKEFANQAENKASDAVQG